MPLAGATGFSGETVSAPSVDGQERDAPPPAGVKPAGGALRSLLLRLVTEALCGHRRVWPLTMAISFCAPKERTIPAQGEALGQGATPPSALKGRTKPRDPAPVSTPFQGWRRGLASLPRALPWAGIVRTFGAQAWSKSAITRGQARYRKCACGKCPIRLFYGATLAGLGAALRPGAEGLAPRSFRSEVPVPLLEYGDRHLPPGRGRSQSPLGEDQPILPNGTESRWVSRRSASSRAAETAAG